MLASSLLQPATATVSLLSLGTLYWLAWIVYARLFHPLRRVPGPFFASISRTWLVYVTIRGDMDKVQRDLHRRYGPLVRISPNEVSCADPEAIKVIYPAQAPLTKTEFYPVWDNKKFSKHVDHFSVTDEKVHTQRRRIVNHVYTLSNVLQCEPYIDRCGRMFIKRLGEIADNSGTLDLGEWLQWYAFDVIGQLYFGNMFGFLDKAKDHDSYIQSLDTLMPVLLMVAVSPTYTRPFILISSMFSSAVRKGLAAVDHIAQAARQGVETRVSRKDEKADRDLLQQLLDIVREKGEKVDFGIPEVQNEAYVGLFAGSDTTAVALRATLYYAMKHPDTYRKLQAEIDEAERLGKLSDVVQYAEAIELPFFCACVKEAMRLHPSVGLSLPRFSPAEGMTLSGAFIPPGYTVGINAAVVHYDKDVFGKDADQYRPERWLEPDTARMEKTFFAFGAGTRTCIGKNISLAEIHKIIPQVLRNFDLSLASDLPWKTLDHWFHKQTGIQVNIKRRAKTANSEKGSNHS